jgi:hypothetical protein
MFSGIQEILVLVIIILALFFLPRILSRGQEKQAAVRKPMIMLSGKIRLAVAASVLWPAVVAAFIQPWKGNLILFLYLGLGPVAVVWGSYWVFIGFRKK